MKKPRVLIVEDESSIAELIAVKHGKLTEPSVAAVSMKWEGALKK